MTTFTIKQQGTYSIERDDNEARVYLHGLLIISDDGHEIEPQQPGPHLTIMPQDGETLDQAIERAHSQEIVPSITLASLRVW